jgi:hypothetical protein
VRHPVLVAAAAGAALVVVYLALGGASYTPAAVADPCTPRDWRGPDGLQEVAEQIVLSALDGAACDLRISREEMVLALSSASSRDRFVREHDITHEELEHLVRTGLERAVDDADDAGAINSTVADVLRAIVRRIPVDEILDLVGRLPG